MMNPPPLLDRSTSAIKRRHTYELYAMIIHKGSVGSGHYYALIRHPSGSWFNFNDADISLVKQDDKLLQQSMQAYILFYEKKWVFGDAHNQPKLPKQISVGPTRMVKPSAKASAKPSAKASAKPSPVKRPAAKAPATKPAKKTLLLGKRPKPPTSVAKLAKKVSKAAAPPKKKPAASKPKKPAT